MTVPLSPFPTSRHSPTSALSASNEAGVLTAGMCSWAAKQGVAASIRINASNLFIEFPPVPAIKSLPRFTSLGLSLGRLLKAADSTTTLVSSTGGAYDSPMAEPLIVESEEELKSIVRSAKKVAVVGIKDGTDPKAP